MCIFICTYNPLMVLLVCWSGTLTRPAWINFAGVQ